MSRPIHLHSIHEGNPANPPLVILHGLFGSVSNWRRITKALSTDYYVTCLDLRNHGNSPWTEAMNYTSMAWDVAETLTREGMHHSVVLGHSMGGKTTMALAQQKLIPLQAIIIADIAPIPYSHDHGDLIAAMESVELDSIVRRADADQQLAQYLVPAAVRQFLLQNLIRKSKHFHWRINLPTIRRSLPALLDWEFDTVTQVKSLFVYGEKSHYMNEAGRAAIHQYFPNSTLTSIASAGHWLHVEQPDRFMISVLDFLRDCVGNTL